MHLRVLYSGFIRGRRVIILSFLSLVTFTSFVLVNQKESTPIYTANMKALPITWKKQNALMFSSSRMRALEIEDTNAIQLNNIKVVHNRFHLKTLSPSHLNLSIHTDILSSDLNEIENDGANSDEKEPPELQPIPTKKIKYMMPHKIISAVPKRYVSDKMGYLRYKEYLNMVEKPLPKQEKAVIILTNHRSGSSFFGELFNQHPDAFYLFENLFPLSNSTQCNFHTKFKMEAIRDLIHCQLPDWAEIYKGIPPGMRITKNSNMRDCLRKKVCFRQNTKEMCEDRHCPSNMTRKMNCQTECGELNPQLVSNDCRKKQMVALKVIRLCDILQLEEVFKSTSADVKILHLIRDPRAIANSRLILNRRLNLKNSIMNTCQRQSHNMKSALDNTPDWLKGRYKIFRYEDAALFPYETAQNVYDFVGLGFPNSMKMWIANNTDIDIPTAFEVNEETNGLSSIPSNDNGERLKRNINSNVQKVMEENKKIKSLQAKRRYSDPYSTKRNSAKIVQKWTHRLSYSTVIFIENICISAMKMAGYITVGTPQQYIVKGNKTYFTDEILAGVAT